MTGPVTPDDRAASAEPTEPTDDQSRAVRLTRTDEAPQREPVRRNHPGRPRIRLWWFAVGWLLVAVIFLREIGTLLGRLHGLDGKSYGPSAFTGPRWLPGDTSSLEDALTVWTIDPEIAELAGGWVRAHVWVDLAGFAPAYLLLLWFVLRRVIPPTGSRNRWRTALYGAPLVLGVIEVLEGWATLDLLDPVWEKPFVSGESLWIIPVLSTTKWIVLVATVGIIVFAYARRDSLRGKHGAAAAALHAGTDRQAIPAMLAGVFATLSLFGLLVALPAGGPLEQIPDVVRAQLEEFDAMWNDEKWSVVGSTLVLSSVALLMLAMAVGLAVLLATAGGQRRAPTGDLGGSWVRDLVVGLALALAALVVPLALSWRAGDFDLKSWSNYPLALTFLVILVASWAVRGLHRSLRVDSDGPAGSGDAPAVTPDESARMIAPTLAAPVERSSTAAEEAAKAAGQWAEGELRAARVEAAIEQQRRLGEVMAADLEARKRRAWVAGLTASIGVVGSIGVIRALAPGLLLESRDDWFLLIIVSVAVVGLVPFAVMASSWKLLRLAAIGLLPLSAAGAVAWAGVLMAQPAEAGRVGSTGALAIGTAPFVLLVAVLAVASQRFRWRPTVDLGLGPRTPWLALLVAGWLFAGALDTAGGYHDARLRPAESSSTETRGLNGAFAEWAAVDRPLEGCSSGTARLLLVAAPGGGIRAAYWTAIGLDRLTAECPSDLFVVSGVSGGAVGTVATLAGVPGNGAVTVTKMSEDTALAASVASTLLRDLLQPLTGTRTGWSDRAAAFEDRWIESAPDALGPVDDPLLFSEVGDRWADQVGYKPVIMLGGSSVNDGCRAMISNVVELPASSTDCAGAAVDGSGAGGVLTRSLDLRAGLLDPFNGTSETNWNDRWVIEPQPASGDSCAPPTADALPELRAVTAALLAARFPYVSPSGALRRCVEQTPERSGPSATPNHTATPSVSTSYVVDGGYYENHGLHALLETWEALAPKVEACNFAARAEQSGQDPPPALAPEDCPMGDGERLVIEPMMVVLHASYRSTAEATSSRPKELVLPPSTFLGAKGELMSDTALEQAATLAMARAGDDNGYDGYVRLGLESRPGLAAPLGWVLSGASRAEMDRDMRVAFVAAFGELPESG